MEDQNWKRALDKRRAVAAIRHGAAYGSVSASVFAAVLASVFASASASVVLGADDRQVEGGGKGGAMGRENNNGGAAPAAGQGKRAMPANLGVGPENSFCQAKHRQDNGKCIYTGAKYS